MTILIKNNRLSNFFYFIYKNTLFYFNYLFKIISFNKLIISILQYYFIDFIFSI